MFIKTRLYRATYKNGLHKAYTFEAVDEKDAVITALAEYRRNYGFVETVHEWPAEKIIEKIELVDGTVRNRVCPN